MHSFLLILVFITAFSALYAAAFYDWVYFKIPNVIPTILLGAFIIFAILLGDVVWSNMLMISTTAFLLSFCLWYFGIWGGGDAKFFIATAIWCPWKFFPAFFLWMSIFGGVLCFILLLGRRSRRLSSSNNMYLQPFKVESPVPYGVAICLAGVMQFTALLGSKTLF